MTDSTAAHRPDRTVPAVSPEIVIRQLAAGQHGVVSRAQLLHAGLSSRAIECRLKNGRLESLHRGVYRAGPAPAHREREMAAVLACGLEAVLSHASAAVAWELLPNRAWKGPVHVSIRSGYRRHSSGIRFHRVRTLEPDETTILDGLPITTPARTLVDMATSHGQRTLELALARAERHRLAERDEVATLVARRRWVRGAPAVRALLARNGPLAYTRSEAEAEFLDLVRRAGLPPPEVNSKVEGYEVDFLWRSVRLVAEVDGFEFHSSRDAFEQDRKRDGVLLAAGFGVFRVTWRQLTGEPEAVLARLLRAMERHGK